MTIRPKPTPRGPNSVRAPGPGELRDAAGDLLPPIEPEPLGPEHFVRTEELQEALRGVGKIDAGQFFADIDSVVDPTPRYWPAWED